MWDLLILDPMINALLFLYGLMGRSFWLSITIFTILTRLILLPLTLRQQQSAQAMQALQPKLQELQKKYGKDRERLAQEQMKLYKEHGVNPLGGCLPTLLQFPIMLGLYQAIIRVLGTTPLQLLDLSRHIYGSAATLSRLLPLDQSFLWLDLGRPDPLYILPILVVITTWAQQKLMTPPATDPQSASMTQSMQVMMPLMFGFFAMQFSSGLSIYFIISNLVGIVQYYLIGRKQPAPAPQPAPARQAKEKKPARSPRRKKGR